MSLRLSIDIPLSAGLGWFAMITRCEICSHEPAGDEVEHLYKAKSYCQDCYKAVKRAETVNEKPDA
jgi:hypothetical protein